jgi:hypothetical protein
MVDRITRRDWQRMLKGRLTPLQYRYIDVEGHPDGPDFVAYLIDPETQARIHRVPLDDLDTAVAILQQGLAGVREPLNPDVTILVHHPGP